VCILRNWVGGVSPQFPELLGLQPEAVYEFTLFLASNDSSCHRPEYPHGMEGKENEKKSKTNRYTWAAPPRIVFPGNRGDRVPHPPTTAIA
jgi:hypothetical protein